VERTSEGIQISANQITVPRGQLFTYTLSSAEAEMDLATARALARIISRLRHPDLHIDLLAGKPGIFHLIIDPDGQRRAPRFAAQASTQAARITRGEDNARPERGAEDRPPGFKLGKHWRIRRSEILAWMDGRRVS
jgi:hypothetical protein